MITHTIRTQNVTYQGLDKDDYNILIVCSCGWQEEIDSTAHGHAGQCNITSQTIHNRIAQHRAEVIAAVLGLEFVIGEPLPDFVHPE